MREDSNDYRRVFLSGVPLLDTRAPIEFAKGAFPGAVNLPLLSDAEREAVGTCYKTQGQDAAIALGHKLVSGRTKAERVAAWADFARAHPEGYLYCFRGGLRSRISQQWLEETAGIRYPRVVGGYKAMRGYLLRELERAVDECRFVVLSGLTGTGKTDLLRELDNGIDLEAHARHRGSSFGQHAGAQPVQIDFDNSLAIDFLKKRAGGQEGFVLEDEGRHIGSCSLPLALYQGMPGYPVVWLEDAMDSRVSRILRDYVVDLRAEFVAMHGEDVGFERFADRLRRSLGRIVRRLGDERHRRVGALMEAALEAQRRSGGVELHRLWIERLLVDYYDPMYAYQRQSKAPRIEFAGTRGAVLEYLRRRSFAP
ncbi:tRNA 2-selenouridine(34) synthase MnmH [Alcaligenaceae bacterium]|nr:tRNA 2-selenouridine(34) synthase MnmH [Alcaligenaceae bacterium]